MPDETLDKLGTYFIYHDIHKRYGITFYEFVLRWQIGSWVPWLAEM